VAGQFEFTRDKTVSVNHCYFYIDDVTAADYTAAQMTYDLRRLRLKGLIFRPPKTHRYFLTPYGWKVARLFTRLEARVF
jgi:hypothetical protein